MTGSRVVNCAMQHKCHYGIFTDISHEDYPMGLRGFFVLAVLLASAPDAFAGEQSGVLRRVSCSVVRYYVAKYTASVAESWARSKGATEAEIESARRCLKGTPILTAQNAQNGVQN